MNKVYVNRPDHFFFYNVKMTADYCHFPFETVFVDEETNNSADWKKKRGHLKYPILETPEGKLIGESSAIAAYMARAAGNTSYLGSNAFEEAQVNQWVEFAGSEIAPKMYPVAYHVFGWADNKAAHDAGVKGIKESVKVLNGRLADRAWLVGDKLTLADIVTFNALLFPFSFVLDGGFRKAMPNAAAWFLKMSKLPVVTRSAGYVKWVGAGNEPAGGAPAGGKGKAKGGDAKGGKGGKGGKKAEPKKEEKPAAAPADDDLGEDDLFGDDDEADAKAAEARKKQADAAKAKKKKEAPIAKSIIMWEVKPLEDSTDLEALFQKIIAIEMDGLVWKQDYKKEPVAFGIFKIVICAVVEDEKVSVDIVEEKICEFEDEVQSVDVLSFNKL